MAGSEKTGWENATESLFVGRACFVTPVRETNGRALESIVRFWHELGAEVTTLDPDAHDEIVAHISHLPQVIAASLCHFLAQKTPGWRNFAGGGLRDTTRLGAGDPTMWIEILRQNRERCSGPCGNIRMSCMPFKPPWPTAILSNSGPGSNRPRRIGTPSGREPLFAWRKRKLG